MKIRTLVQATPTGKVGDVHAAEIDTDSGTAWVMADFGGFRLGPHEFEILQADNGRASTQSAPVAQTAPQYANCQVCNAGIPLGTARCDACLETDLAAAD